MSDRELLEAAAKAAGWQVDQRASHMTWRDSQKLALHNPQGGHTLWNSINDDGDAFRLAVKLRLEITQFSTHVRVCAADGDDFHEDQGADPYAATRRAITRAAAAIGARDE